MNQAIKNIIKRMIQEGEVSLKRSPGTDVYTILFNRHQVLEIRNAWDYGEYGFTIFTEPKIEKNVSLRDNEEKMPGTSPEDIELKQDILEYVMQAVIVMENSKRKNNPLEAILSTEEKRIQNFYKELTSKAI